MQIWTVNEQDCYDAGFANGEPYWRDLEQERIIEIAKKRICFEFKNGCEHANCYELFNLILAISKVNK